MSVDLTKRHCDTCHRGLRQGEYRQFRVYYRYLNRQGDRTDCIDDVKCLKAFMMIGVRELLYKNTGDMALALTGRVN